MKKENKKSTIVCDQCGKEFIRFNCHIKRQKERNNKYTFCSDICCKKYKAISFVKKPCKYCGKEVRRINSQTKKSKTKNIFCNRSCAASYNNTLKRKSRRSKVEIMLFEMLKKEFPKLNIINNDKKLLDGFEADIAIPSLKLAIEWNGIIHFKPIHGQTKLNKIQSNDAKKQIIAQQKGINLIVIPDLVSTKARVKEAFTSVSKIIRQLID